MAAFRVRVPGSIGNVGPGFDCLGAAISGLYDEVSVKPAVALEIRSVTGRQSDLVPRDIRGNALTIAAQSYFENRGVKSGASFALHRNLPLAGGLGSSAAAAVAGAVAAAKICGDEIKSAEVLAAALAGESAVAGRHVDNIAPCLLGGLVLVRGCDWSEITKLPITGDWHFVVVTPNQLLKTKDSRDVLAANLPTKDWVKQMSASCGVVTAFLTGNQQLLGQSLVDAYAEPARGKLIAGFAAVKAAALAAGALGCSISGGGPSVFAVCASQALAAEVAKAMVAVWENDCTAHVSGFGLEGTLVLEGE